MTKDSFKYLLSKWNVLAIALVAMMSVGLSSCGSDDDPEPSPAEVTITNNSSGSYNRFTVYFRNKSNEFLSTRDYGTLSPGQHVSSTIPTGAATYFISIYSNGTTYVSADYEVSITSLSLTDESIWYY